jgi:hypothetical protein
MTHPNRIILGNCRYALALARLLRRRRRRRRWIGHLSKINGRLGSPGTPGLGRDSRQNWLGCGWRLANRLSRRIQIGNGRLDRRRCRLGKRDQPLSPSIATTLFSTTLLALFARSPSPSRLSTAPLLGLTSTRLAAIMTSRMGRPKETLAPFKQATPTTKSMRRTRRLLCRIPTNVILMGAQGSAAPEGQVSETSCCSLRDALFTDPLLFIHSVNRQNNRIRPQTAINPCRTCRSVAATMDY